MAASPSRSGASHAAGQGACRGGAGAAGDIAAVAKVDEIRFDAVLHDAAEDDHIHLAPLPFPKPVHGLAIEPKRHGDEQRMWEILTKLVDEDPCLKLEHLAGTNETVVYGLGELHLRLLLERLRETFRFEVTTRPPRVAYRETITAKAEGHHRHKKQAAAPASSARCTCASSRCRAASGFEFLDQVKGGTIPASSSPRSRRACARCSPRRHRRPSGGRRARDRLRRQAPQRRQQGDRLRHRRPQGLPAAVRDGAADRARADRPRRDQRAGQALGDITGDLASRRGMVSGTANGAPGTMTVRGQAPMSGAARLPEPAQRADQRPGPLHRRVLALRGGPGEHAAAAGRRVQGARRRLSLVGERGDPVMSDSAPGPAAPHDVPIPYIERTRSYYQALGYGAPYEWAHCVECRSSP
jgi:hypothetical protein